ncbi:myo-inositol-1(or 4)-monophosphatase [Kribbella voronezhensis]|uniref:Myo-inositol-1(Or 4)-monophosphatase n=1 Tax=Kribbella voronezhensis TaxID=2512212 RepID=A0A4R7TBT2_9ACTN|nr:inositol monophosphatase family protein [Kribbella voronezhensis]TDU89455.1 myo-inositol-1(or 4)-monophosphatase [Kribbella voronezhensis]
MTDLHALLATANEAVSKAADIIRSRQPGMLTAKGDRDMASEVDYAVEKALRRFLAAATPQIGFLGEEEGRTAGNSDELLWVLDPVDGTVNFIHGLPIVAVSLGLVAGDHSILGVIDMPLMDRRYAAADGLGATLDGQSIRGSKCARLSDALVAIGDYAVGEAATQKNVQRLALTALLAANVQRIRMLGTAATDLAWVAEGILDASVMFTNKPWDTSAGVLIAREAGVQVLDIDGSQHTFNANGTVSVAKPLAAELLDLIHEASEYKQ